MLRSSLAWPVHIDDFEVSESDIFIIKYAAETQPGLVTHADGAHISIGIALNSPDAYVGGCCGDADEQTKGAEGEAMLLVPLLFLGGALRRREKK